MPGTLTAASIPKISKQLFIPAFSLTFAKRYAPAINCILWYLHHFQSNLYNILRRQESHLNMHRLQDRNYSMYHSLTYNH